MPYVNAGRHHAYKRGSSSQQGEGSAPRCARALSAPAASPGLPSACRQLDQSLQLWGGAVCGKWLLVTSVGPASGAKGQLLQHRTLLSLILLYGQIDHFYSEICCCPVNI